MAAKSKKKNRTTAPAETRGNAPVAADAPTLTKGTARAGNSASERVWAALAANPGATIATITKAARVSRSTATKTLAALEKSGRAVRTRGQVLAGGKATFDSWQPATATDAAAAGHDSDPADPATPQPTSAAEGTGSGEQTGTPTPDDHGADDHDTDDHPSAAVSDAGEPAAGEATCDEQVVPSVQAPADDDGQGEPNPAIEQARRMLTELAAVVTEAAQALSVGDIPAARGQLEVIYTDAAKIRRTVKAALGGRKTARNGDYMRPGQLRDRVLAHLTEHSDSQFTPYEIGRALGNSSGAVANALDRLTDLGHAQLTNERPRRFAAARAEHQPTQ